VKEVKLAFEDITRVKIFESCSSLVAINFDQLMVQVDVNVFRSRDRFKRVRKFKAVWEKIRHCCVEMDFRILAHAVLTEGFLTQVHNFLGSSSTFYRHYWESKDCLPAFEIFTQY